MPIRPVHKEQSWAAWQFSVSQGTGVLRNVMRSLNNQAAKGSTDLLSDSVTWW